MALFLTILTWGMWIVLILIGSVLALFVLAFGGDDPRVNLALRKMLPFGLFAITLALIASFTLLATGGWWRVILAYGLALSPPLLMAALTSVILHHLRRRPPQ